MNTMENINYVIHIYDIPQVKRFFSIVDVRMTRCEEHKTWMKPVLLYFDCSLLVPASD